MSSKVTKVPEDQQKLIAIDYDGTITADVEMWIEIIKIIIAHGHEVVIATMRTQEEKKTMDDRIVDLVPWIVPTSRKAKLPFLKAFGIEPDIWIDDQPTWLFADAL